MICQWDALMRIVPKWMRSEVDKLGAGSLQELRLRLGGPPILLRKSSVCSLDQSITPEDLSFVIHSASQYSPWAAQTIAQGFITAPGGHRVGICGESVCRDQHMTGIRTPTSVCIRVARDFPGLARSLRGTVGSVLVLGPPGSGKTTFLRDLIRQVSENTSVAVLDERGELFPFAQNRFCFSPGVNVDVLSGCGKTQGIDILLRTMSPGIIAMDEITSREDCAALSRAGWNGVSVIATTHAASLDDLLKKDTFRHILETKLFHRAVCLGKDQSWKEVSLS